MNRRDFLGNTAKALIPITGAFLAASNPTYAPKIHFFSRFNHLYFIILTHLIIESFLQKCYNNFVLYYYNMILKGVKYETLS